MIKTSKLVFVDMESEFSFELAQQLYASTQVIDFDWAYLALGYSTKGNAKRMLTSYFEQDFDYFVVTSNESASALPYEIFAIEVEKSKQGRPVEKIYLTVECFKEMGMLAKSESGKRIRRYFLQCEALAKKSAVTIPQLQEEVNSLRQSLKLLTVQVQNLLPTDSNAPPPGWDKKLWNELPSEDKRHFRFLHHRRGFTPSTSQMSSDSIQETHNAVKQQQRKELEAVIKPLSQEEKARFEQLKNKALKQAF
jgi:phage anti-repressor protein